MSVLKVKKNGVWEYVSGGTIEAKTLQQHLQEEEMVLTSLQYGDTLPTPGVVGRIFFKKVDS